MSEFKKIGTVMLVDDDVDDQQLYKRMLDRSGQVENIISFIYPDEALDFLLQPDREEVDVIFLDINMPRMSGFEFLEKATAELGTNFVKILVVMLTTSLNPEDEERAKQFEVVKGYLNKPLDIDDIQHVCKLLEEASFN